ncbi:MAG TPA: hypothetical protein VF598_06235 [Hymenobacter sp.]
MSKEQETPAQDKQANSSSLDQVNKDLEANRLQEDEQGQIEGGFAAGSVDYAVPPAEDNIWCNTNC